MFVKISYTIKEFTSSKNTPLLLKIITCILKATPPSLKMNNPTGIEEWLTSDQEINMVHYVNEIKLKENALNVDDKSKNTDYSKDDFMKKIH